MAERHNWKLKIHLQGQVCERPSIQNKIQRKMENLLCSEALMMLTKTVVKVDAHLKNISKVDTHNMWINTCILFLLQSLKKVFLKGKI